MIIYGIHPALDFVKNHPDLTLEICIKPSISAFSNIEELAKKYALKLTKCSDKTLNNLVQGNHQGIVIKAKSMPIGNEKQLKPWLEKQNNDLILVVLEQLQDPRNLGACFRSAKALNADAVIISKNASTPINETVYKASAGTLASLKVFQVSNIARVLQTLQQHNIWLIGMDGEANKSLYQAKLNGSIALIVGNEGQGLKKRTCSICDELYRIDMEHDTDSLNVTSALSIALFEVNRQRHQT